MKNYYDVLGVAFSAPPEEIKRAYRKLSIKFHPDKNNGDQFFEERFKQILEAYNILSNSQKKDLYDLKFKAFFNNAKSSHQNPHERNSNFYEEEIRRKKYEEKVRNEYEEKLRQEKETFTRDFYQNINKKHKENKNPNSSTIIKGKSISFNKTIVLLGVLIFIGLLAIGSFNDKAPVSNQISVKVLEEKGSEFFKAQNYDSAFHYYITIYELENKIDSMAALNLYNFGYLYDNGLGTEKDVRMAIDLYEKASKSGDNDLKNSALLKAGILYYKNFTDWNSMEKAFNYFLISARFGDKQGMDMVGTCYELGWGTNKNISESKFWLNKAALMERKDALRLKKNNKHKKNIIVSSNNFDSHQYEENREVIDSDSEEDDTINYQDVPIVPEDTNITFSEPFQDNTKEYSNPNLQSAKYSKAGPEAYKYITTITNKGIALEVYSRPNINSKPIFALPIGYEGKIYVIDKADESFSYIFCEGRYGYFLTINLRDKKLYKLETSTINPKHVKNYNRMVNKGIPIEVYPEPNIHSKPLFSLPAGYKGKIFVIKEVDETFSYILCEGKYGYFIKNNLK